MTPKKNSEKYDVRNVWTSSPQERDVTKKTTTPKKTIKGSHDLPRKEAAGQQFSTLASGYNWHSEPENHYLNR